MPKCLPNLVSSLNSFTTNFVVHSSVVSGIGKGGEGDITFDVTKTFTPSYRQLVLALETEQSQLKSIRNKIQEVNWQRKQEQV